MQEAAEATRAQTLVRIRLEVVEVLEPGKQTVASNPPVRGLLRSRARTRPITFVLRRALIGFCGPEEGECPWAVESRFAARDRLAGMGMCSVVSGGRCGADRDNTPTGNNPASETACCPLCVGPFQGPYVSGKLRTGARGRGIGSCPSQRPRRASESSCKKTVTYLADKLIGEDGAACATGGATL